MFRTDPAARYRPTPQPIEVIGLPLLDDDERSPDESEIIQPSSAAILNDQLFLLLRSERKHGKRSRLEVYDVTYDALAAILVLTNRRRVEMTGVAQNANVIKLVACRQQDCVFLLTQQIEDDW